MNVVGDFIAALRVEKNLSRIELAQQLDIPYKAVDMLEDGLASPDKSQLRKLCSFFEVTPEEILCGRRLFYEDGSRYASKELIKERKLLFAKKTGRFRLACILGAAVVVLTFALSVFMKTWGSFAFVLTASVAVSLYLYLRHYFILKNDDDIIPVRTRYSNYVDVVRYTAYAIGMSVILCSISAMLCLGGNVILRVALAIVIMLVFLAGVRYVMERRLWRLEKKYKRRRLKNADIIYEPSEVDREIEKLEGYGIF